MSDQSPGPSNGSPDDESATRNRTTETMPHSSTTWKVLGEVEARDGTGVLGHNTATTGTAHGVTGVTDSGLSGAAGVKGQASASNAFGVLSAGDSKTSGDHEVTGTLLGSGIVGTGNLASGAVTDAEVDANTTISRSKLETDRIQTAVSANYTTSGEETIMVESSTQSVTVTLSSSDAVAGRSIRIVDEKGSASTNSIDVVTEGAETIVGPSATTISTSNGYREYEYDGFGVWHEVSAN